MTRLIPTAHITTGPFFPSQFIRAADSDLTRGGTVPGQVIVLSGQVTDGDGMPCVNSILELWQADAQGRYGVWGRTWTDTDGAYRFVTIKPGAAATRAPCINVMIHASGLMRPLTTQMFFPGEALNDDDPQLRLVPAERRGLLIARPQHDPQGHDPQAPDGAMPLRFDIALAGPNETPFLED